MRTLPLAVETHRLEGRRTTMKSKPKRNPIRSTVLASIVLATCAFAAAAYAQPSFVGSFTLPHEVHWGAALLPAGDYTIVVDSLDGPATIRSAKGEGRMFTPAPIQTDGGKGKCSLFITIFNGERRVRSLNLPRLGQSLIYAPLSKEERETLPSKSSWNRCRWSPPRSRASEVGIAPMEEGMSR
jgi:hypothetical protein